MPGSHSGFEKQPYYATLLDKSRVKMKSDSAVTEFLQGRLKVLQGVRGYRFSVDAVLLANFIDEPLDRRIIDLGTGCGIIPLIMAAERRYKDITGVEIQKRLAAYAVKNVSLNKLDTAIKILHSDFRSFITNPPGKLFDAAVANPPYKKPGTGKINPSREKAIARHEIKCSLENLILSAAASTKKRGTFYLIYHPFRLDELIIELKKNEYHLERLCSVHPRHGEPASLFLLKAAKRSSRETVIEPPVYIYEATGEYTPFLRRILGIN